MRDLSGSELYFAYGSNLCDDDRRRWAASQGVDDPLGEVVGNAYLPDTTLSFGYRSKVREGGALTIDTAVGQVVPGALYRVNRGGWDALDRKEGVSEGRYARVAMHALDARGGVTPCATYAVTPAFRRAHCEPTADYLEVVTSARASHGLVSDDLQCVARGEPAAPLADQLFVYGTLMAGECRHLVLTRSQCVRIEPRRAQVDGRLWDLGDYPGWEPPRNRAGASARAVPGELYPILEPQTLFRVLDAVEAFVGYDAASEYHRVLVDCRVDGVDEKPSLAWTYAITESSLLGATPIASNSWRDREAIT